MDKFYEIYSNDIIKRINKLIIILFKYNKKRKMCYNIRCDNSLMVRIAAFQAVGPGSIPGCRKFLIFLKYY